MNVTERTIRRDVMESGLTTGPEIQVRYYNMGKFPRKGT